VRGDLDGARKLFAAAAAKGLAEGALAFGTTYDPVSLAKLGLNDGGDPSRARQWYRKAYVMVMRPK
jgi:TPR repeat protein